MEISLYIHIPFCISKCRYCDFLSAQCDDGVKVRYAEALCREIRAFAQNSRHRRVKSVFFGGGTPSVLGNNEMRMLLDVIHDEYVLSDSCEITVECNPGTVTYDKFRMYAEHGVNRISMGLQSSDNADLKLLGRIHTYEDYMESLEYAKKAGFVNINADLMSGLPGQTAEKFTKILKDAISSGVTHISAYSLIIEEGTPFGEMYGKGLLVLPDEDEDRRIYHETGKVLEKAGFNRYEISNYSKPGYESVHNKVYWEREDYKGFGTGAASLIDNVRYTNTPELEEYIYNGITAVNEEKLNSEDCMAEYMFLGLRMMKGIDVEDFNKKFNADYDKLYGKITEKHISSGLLTRNGSRIRLTEKGIDVSNYVFSDFLLT